MVENQPPLLAEGVEPQKGSPKRLAEEPCDFSQIDFAEPEIRRRLKAAYRVLIEYRLRRLCKQAND